MDINDFVGPVPSPGDYFNRRLAWIFHSHFGKSRENPMKRGALLTRANAWLKRHGTQVWKPAIRQAGKPALQWFAMVLPVSL